MFRSRSHLQATALWLALAGVVLRSLVPVGFMPGWTSAGGVDGAPRWLIVCPTSPLHGALADPTPPPTHDAAGHHDHAAMLAAMAAADDPHAGHHGHHGDAAATVADGHDGHAAGEHGGHRIAAEHLSCPFAGAAAAALPVADGAFAVTVADGRELTAVRPADAVVPVRRRLPPARAPPAPHDDHALA
jgi:hypothetical protein